MLKQTNRPNFATLLDAITLHDGDEARAAIIYLETEQPAVVVSRPGFRRAVTTYAAALRHMGLRPGDLIIIAHTQNLESIFAFWEPCWSGPSPPCSPPSPKS